MQIVKLRLADAQLAQTNMMKKPYLVMSILHLKQQ
jgi:hypothetical protein